MRLQLLCSKLLTISVSCTILHNYMTLRSDCRGRNLRDGCEILLPKVKSAICQSTFKFTGAKDWNELPKEA